MANKTIAPFTVIDTFSRTVSNSFGTSDSGVPWVSVAGTVAAAPVTSAGFKPGDLLKTTEAVNVRQGYGLQYKIMTTLAKGAMVKVITDDVGNYRVTRDGYVWYNVSGSFGTGWAAANWFVPTSLIQAKANIHVKGYRGEIVSSAATTYESAYLDLRKKSIPLQTNGEVLMRAWWTSGTTWPQTDFGPTLAVTNHTNYYYLSVQANPSVLAIYVVINGVKTLLKKQAIPSLPKDTKYWIRFQKYGTTLFGKIWKAGVAEPTAWSISAAISTNAAAPKTGNAGVVSHKTANTHSIHLDDYYYDTMAPNPASGSIVDTFSRVVTNAWGISSSGDPWEGSSFASPDYPSDTFAGGVTTADNGYGYFDATGGEVLQYNGVPRTGDAETFTRFSMGAAASGVGYFRVGVRGRKASYNNRFHTDGYMAQVATGSSTITLYKRAANTANWTAIGSATGPEAVLVNKKYCIKIQAKGTAIKAKFWVSGAAEPVWQATATDSSYTTGTGFLIGRNGDASKRRFNIFDFEYTPPDPDIPGPFPYTTPGTVNPVAGTITDTSAKVRATYTNDSDGDSSLIVDYRPTSSTKWTRLSPAATANRASKYFEFTLTGLLKGTSYTVRAQYVDPDGVKGTNPVSMVFSTTATGVKAGELKLVSITTNSAVLETSYSADTNNNASARFYSRVAAQPIEHINDYFTDSYVSLALENYDSPFGGKWYKHSATSMGARSYFGGGGYYAKRLKSTDKILYFRSPAASTNDTIQRANIRIDSAYESIGIAGRISNTANTYYGGGYDAEEGVWELFKMVNGVKTVLDTSEFTFDGSEVFDLHLVTHDTHKTLYVDDVVVCGSTDNTITSGWAGWYAGGVQPGAKTNKPNILLTFSSEYRGAAGAWVEHSNVVVNRTLKKITGTATGLVRDTVYDFNMTYIDSGTGSVITGVNPALRSAMTLGQAASLISIGAAPKDTSANLMALVGFDTNRNCTVSFAYKDVADSMWIYPTFDKVNKYRSAGRFEHIATNLKPGTTYNLTVTITDPDGLMAKSPSKLTGLFTTKSSIAYEYTPDKVFMWKVYNRAGQYLSTIHDTPAPEYTFYENGGATDLELEIHRNFDQLDRDKIIDFQHRIDIWAVDNSGRGLGPNLISDPEVESSVGGWLVGKTTGVYGLNSSIRATDGPDGGSALRIVAPDNTEYPQASNPIHITDKVPLIVSCRAKAASGKLRLFVESFTSADQTIDSSDETAETVGNQWQQLKITYTPPEKAAYIRVFVENDNKGVMYADKFEVRARELKIYSGHIEAYTPEINATGERLKIQVLGLSAFLSDDYIEFLQFVEYQPNEDIKAGRINHKPADPADMMKKIIDTARTSNKRFPLYYTSDSIRNTGVPMQYTFRDKQVRHAMDKVRDLCPAGWHYFVDADGLVTLRGPQHAPTHILKLGVDITDFEVEKSIRNLKNYIRIRGRQDEDKSEMGSHGTIKYDVFDQASINKFGKRVTIINDSQIIDNETARMMGDGRLEELNREEQRVTCTVLDEKSLDAPTGSMVGYNIEAFRPGDNVIIEDPIAGSRYSYWNQMVWDKDHWDTGDAFKPIPVGVPIKTIKYKANEVELELSERPPSQVGDYAKLYKWLAMKDKE